MAKIDLGLNISHAVVEDAVARFLASGGQVQKVAERPNTDWTLNTFLSNLREDREITVSDAVADTTDYSGAAI